jgi:hypothetical protein
MRGMMPPNSQTVLPRAQAGRPSGRAADSIVACDARRCGARSDSRPYRDLAISGIGRFCCKGRFPLLTKIFLAR